MSIYLQARNANTGRIHGTWAIEDADAAEIYAAMLEAPAGTRVTIEATEPIETDWRDDWSPSYNTHRDGLQDYEDSTRRSIDELISEILAEAN